MTMGSGITSQSGHVELFVNQEKVYGFIRIIYYIKNFITFIKFEFLIQFGHNLCQHRLDMGWTNGS